MSDPFSKAIRRYLSWSKCREFERELETNSMIQQSNCSTAQIQERVAELLRYEEKFGFVYFGEKKWLESCQCEGFKKSYPEWVFQRLNGLIFSDGLTIAQAEVGCEESNKDVVYWHGYTEDLFFHVSFNELPCEPLIIDNLSLFVPGNGLSPDLNCTTRAFHLLHYLSYFLHMAGQRLSKCDCDFALDEIVLFDEGHRWVIAVITEYGGGIDFEFDEDGIR